MDNKILQFSLDQPRVVMEDDGDVCPAVVTYRGETHAVREDGSFGPVDRDESDFDGTRR
jgi:hypothetical protein